jgi:hypothetical protein
MRSIVVRLVSLLAMAVLAAALGAGTASAAPSNAPSAIVATLDCGGAGTFDVVVNGRGEWGAGHLLDGNGVVIPLSFGEETAVVRDAEGNVVDEFTEPATTKGRARARGRERVTCAYTATVTDDGFTVTITGTVTGFISGAPS